ncbi:MAG TPA: hypothetical protein VKQ71_17590 [Acidimicrobiales bacterium]|nr:hypothetical protein [Acidimicrobiales bacterium]
MSSTNVPTPGTGPDATLNLTDPSTWLMILTAIGGIITAAWPGHNIAPAIQAVALAIPGLIAAAVLFGKHHLAAALATAGAFAPAAAVAAVSSTMAALAAAPAAAAAPVVVSSATPAPPTP